MNSVYFAAIFLGVIIGFGISFPIVFYFSEERKNYTLEKNKFWKYTSVIIGLIFLGATILSIYVIYRVVGNYDTAMTFSAIYIYPICFVISFVLSYKIKTVHIHVKFALTGLLTFSCSMFMVNFLNAIALYSASLFSVKNFINEANICIGFTGISLAFWIALLQVKDLKDGAIQNKS